MISNAIPGITNVNSYVNTQSAKGIAVKQSSNLFQKKLTTASADNTAAELTSSFSKTLTKAVNSSSETKTTEKITDKVSNESTEKNEVKTTETKDDTKVINEDSNQRSSETEETADVRDATETEKATETEDAEVTKEVDDAAEQVQVTEELPQIIVTADDNESEMDAALIEASRQLMQQLSEELDVDISEIENVMATLGLTNAAILDPANMTQIIGELTGADDVMAIVTNADIYLNVQNMQDAVDTARQDLMQEFNMSEEDLSSALEEFAQNPAEQGKTEGAATDNIMQNVVLLEASGSEEMAAESISSDNITKESAVKVEVNSFTENGETVEETLISEIKPAEEKNDETAGNMESDNGNDGSMFNHMMTQISSSLSEVSETEAAQQMARANTEQIMEQITEFIRVNVKADTTSMELQLHPQSLGTVNVMIEQAKDGNMIAKFMTQNEDVKAVIEGQLQQLVERFNEQGVKVTAVEVSVNANGFDQTLNDSQSQKDEDRENQESIRKPMRRINLGDLSMEDGDILDIDEEDQLTAEMMAINGNSVDFSA